MNTNKAIRLFAATCIAITLAAQTQAPAFEVASVKPSPEKFTPPLFPLDNSDAFKPTGGRFIADFPLTIYIQFAYKVRFTPEQRQALLAHLPKWVASERFTIEAKADGNATKDQMRLMMRSVLSDRFKLVVHFETQEVPLFYLTLLKPGKLGPKLRPHSEGPPCDVPPASDVYPPICDVYMMMRTPNRISKLGSRNTTMTLLADSVPGNLGRPVVDKTGITEKVDFQLEWAPEPEAVPGSDANPPPEVPGPTLLQALHDQLGLKLEPGKGPIQVLVVDHIERPTEN